MDQTFGKEYKLCNKRQIDAIFASGKSQKSYPLIARYDLLTPTSNVPFQVVITAPKRTFRSAVQRNRIKRICREAVRNNKTELETWLRDRNYQLGIFLLYTGKEEIPFSKLERKTAELFRKIIDDLHKNYA